MGNKEKHCFSRVREGPGAQVGATWAPKSCPRGVRTAKITSNRAAGGVKTLMFRSFGRLYNKSRYFLKCMKKHTEKQGFSRVGEGPGTQVGAIWAQKSCPRGVRPARIISDKAAGGVRTVILRSFGRLCRENCNFLKCMNTHIRNNIVFQWLERVRAPKMEPLGPQSRAREGGQVTLSGRAMDRTGNRTRTKSRRS